MLGRLRGIWRDLIFRVSEEAALLLNRLHYISSPPGEYGASEGARATVLYHKHARKSRQTNVWQLPSRPVCTRASVHAFPLFRSCVRLFWNLTLYFFVSFFPCLVTHTSRSYVFMCAYLCLLEMQTE